MSNPFEPTKNENLKSAIQTIGYEAVSAISALNMQPDPIENHGSKSGYLSETDGWCQHAIKHLQNICVWQRQMEDKYNRMEDILFQLHKAGKINNETLDIILEALKGPHLPN